MEGRPAPGIIGIPVPAAVRIAPATGVAVGSPAGAETSHIRLPTGAIAREIVPGAVRGKIAIKITGGTHVRVGAFFVHLRLIVSARVGSLLLLGLSFRLRRWRRIGRLGVLIRRIGLTGTCVGWSGPGVVAHRLVMGKHGTDDWPGDPDFLEIDDAFGTGVESGAGILDVGSK